MPLLMAVLLLSQVEPITPAQLREALRSSPIDAEALAARIRAAFPPGADLKAGGKGPLIGPDTVAFVVEARARAAPRVEGVMDHGRGWALRRLGETGLWAVAEAVPPDAKFAYRLLAGTKPLGEGVVSMPGWSPPAEAKARPNVAYGEYQELDFKSTVFDRPCRGWIYVPEAIGGAGTVGLTVFLDGDAYRREGIATILENLIADGALPPTIAVGLNPGRFPGGSSARAQEYEADPDRYAQFLSKDVLPLIEPQFPLDRRPASRAIVGASSAGRCAFEVAWRHPELFARACAQLGRFAATGEERPDPDLVREADPKPLKKLVLSGGPNEATEDGWKADQGLLAALKEKGYDADLIQTDGYHNFWTCLGHLPEALRRTWAKGAGR